MAKKSLKQAAMMKAMMNNPNLSQALGMSPEAAMQARLSGQLPGAPPGLLTQPPPPVVPTRKQSLKRKMR